MQQERPAEIRVTNDRPHHLPIEQSDRPLLLGLLGLVAEFAGRDVRQQVHIPAADVRIP